MFIRVLIIITNKTVSLLEVLKGMHNSYNVSDFEGSQELSVFVSSHSESLCWVVILQREKFLV